ncbi:hypothetical protein [Streptomyces subrutilus]|uniref:Uncharacterized protein n=1 Tax=Streptomyces subrutilus TaxID=36818 RepID=A0A1E5PZS4_9ACTN|nr:hypothetical protein [Streptomyces subrutilus]OEJ35148.1 hypothetical protein BGK67_30945 [Streptomyces subrutilus]
MDRTSDATEPELPARVPENREAVTPDLPPLGPAAPDLAGTVEKDGSESPEPAGPAAGPASDKPQEPTD